MVTSAKEVLMMFQRLIVCLFLFVVGMTYGDEKKNCPELTGQVILRSNENYDKARLVSNYYTSKNSFPNVIVYCQTTQDVQNAVKWARCHNLPIRVRSGGHNHEGFSTGTGVIVIDVSKMKKVQVDKVKSIAKVEPGIIGGELYRKLFLEGFTQVGGTCEEVGISGLVLTGGIGPLLRKHGLSCDNLISFEIVDAKGDVLQVASDNEHKDLFWACCGGGGGNFGVVTSLVLKIYPAKQVTWFHLGWDWNQPVEKVIAAWQEFFLKDDNNRWFSHLDLWAKPFSIDRFKKQPIKVMGVFYGTPEDAKRELAPLLTIGKLNDETIELVNWDKSIKLFEDSTAVFITDKPEYKSTGAYAKSRLPDEAISILVETLRNSKTPLLNVLLFTLGGALRDKAPSDTAFFYRDAQIFFQYSSQWLKEKEDVQQIKELDALRERLLPYTKGDYPGNPDRSLKDYLTEYWGGNVARLCCVKRKYDPENIFRFEQSIPPADQECVR